MDLKEQPSADFLRHPWELARYRFFKQVLDAHGLTVSARRVLDAGSGDGWFATNLCESLAQDARVVCWDTGYKTERPGTEGVTFTVKKPKGRFDLILLLDVLEHVTDDRPYLDAIVKENLSPKGYTLVSVPAWNRLYTRHDAALDHHRRYDPRPCRRMIEGAGLTVLEGGGLFHSLLAPRLAQKLSESFFPESGGRPKDETLEWRHGRFSHHLVCKWLDKDTKLSRYAAKKQIPLPGLSWWALCQNAQ